MFIFRFFVPEGDGDAGGNMGGESAPAAGDAGDEEIVETGGTTPEEVASVLRGSGMKVDVPKAEEPSKEEEEAGANPPAPEEPETPAPLQPEKPAETPKPAELPEQPSFKLEVEDAEGNKFEIENIDDLPEDFEPKNNRQGLEILDKLRELRDERKSYEAEQEKRTAETTQAESVAKIQESWNQEIKSLQADKRIIASADPSKNERVDQIFKFMGEENNKRSEAGRPLIATIEDALNALEIKEGREAKAAAAVKAKEDAKRGGSLVGGSSAPASTGTPTYRAGSARNANEAIRQAGLLR